jgi:uncharacterized protein (UPF0335 family)
MEWNEAKAFFEKHIHRYGFFGIEGVIRAAIVEVERLEEEIRDLKAQLAARDTRSRECAGPDWYIRLEKLTERVASLERDNANIVTVINGIKEAFDGEE